MKRLLLGAALLLSFTAFAQDDPHAQHGAVGYVPRDILERPVALRDGVGHVHETVSTASKDAQAFYDQGIAYLHSYVWIEAARSFHEALRLDPKLAMAHIGLSRVYTGLEDPAAAAAELKTAQSLASNTNAWERARIGVRAKQIDALAELRNNAKHLEYKRALDEALATYMDDTELWLLRGNAEEPTAAGRGQRGTAASIAFYEAAMARSPDNFAAHHYLIHSYENMNNMPGALAHGEAYVRLSWAVPHAHHMYGHDLRRVGRIQDAIARFQKADDLEHAYYNGEKIPSVYDWHHEHNLDLLSTAYQYEGQMKTAEKLMREAFAIPAVSEYSEFNKKALPGFLLARGRTDEAMEAAQAMMKGKWPMGRAGGHILAGHCLLVKKQVAAAEQELAAAQKEMEKFTGLNASSIAPYLNGLRGEILLRSGKGAEARPILKEVERSIRAVPGPDAWSQALFRLEAIAKAAREAGDWELAEYTTGQMMEHDAAYAGTHYALALVEEHKGNRAAARQSFAKAEGYWRRADADLPELADARKRPV